MKINEMTTNEAVAAAIADVMKCIEDGEKVGEKITLRSLVRARRVLDGHADTVRQVYTKDGLPLSRVFDRALQKLRRDGKLVYAKSTWARKAV
jgi:hypothetical protein